MSEHVTNESYVSNIREKVVSTAKSMVDGSFSFLEGARTLATLRHDAAVGDDDSDFMTFVVIDSETDDLPIGAVRQNWSKEALDKLNPKIKEAEEWARKVGFEACESLIRRFHV